VEGGGPVRDGNGVRDTAVSGEFFLKRGGLRALGDHAGGEDGEDGVILLVPEGGLGDRYVHGFSSSRS